MLGCMVGSSLSMAPIYQLAEQADFIDLDGPVLVAKDRVNGFIFDGGWMSPSPHHLWGYPDQQ
jgi:L-alanine-DL-glutamate epimerase-like enolase superfamily enzyme